MPDSEPIPAGEAPPARAIVRGDLFWVDWTPGRGSEQTGLRPALVIQTNVANAVTRYPLTIVAAVSTKVKGYPSAARIEPSAGNGLTEPSEVLTGQVLTITKERLGDYIGRLSAADMARVNDKLAYMLGVR